MLFVILHLLLLLRARCPGLRLLNAAPAAVNEIASLIRLDKGLMQVFNGAVLLPDDGP